MRPRKGQMLYVLPEASCATACVARTRSLHCSPQLGKDPYRRDCGRCGFDKSVDHPQSSQLLNAAAKYLPALASAPVTQSWAGLRPGTPDDLPIIGPTDIPRVFAATGHFRNGILLAPITAQIMADLIYGQPSPLDIRAFSPDRFRKHTEVRLRLQTAF